MSATQNRKPGTAICVPGRVKFAESTQSRMAKETSELRFEIKRMVKD